MSEVDLRALTPWHSSVLVAYREVEDECCRIEVWDFETGRLRWDNMICREIFEPVYGDVAAESGVKAWDARFVDLGGDGEPEVVVLIRQITHYPCLIRVYGAQGEILGDYFHRGYVYDVAVKDLDDDGREEIVLGGTSNTSNGAMIAILDEDHLDGMVDATGEASPGFDHSLVRVVLPPFSSQAMRLLNLDRLRAGGFVISRHGDGGATRLRCTVGDARTPIFLTTDSDLRPVSFSFHEHLRNKAEVWIDRGELEPGFGTRSHVMSWLNHHLRFEEGALVESPVLEPEAVSSTR